MVNSNAEDFIRPEDFWRELGVRANQTVVHLGCGAGFYIVPAAKIVGKKGSVIGVDVLEDMLEEAEARAKREGVEDIVTTIRANLESGPTKGLSKDIADWTLVANILYQSDPAKILREAKRVTRTDGTIIVVEWDVADTPLGPPNEMRIAKSEVLSIAKELKLNEVQQFDPSSYHYGLLLNVA